MRPFASTQAQSAQRGMAALVVVTVLFIITSLVAAYTSRNLIFEQRTSANQYRSTQAFEAAEAGIEWSLAMVNHGRITEACESSTDTSASSFRQRYLDIDAGTGNITPRVRSSGEALMPGCVFDGSEWSCHCPSDAAPTLAVPAGASVYPAFRVRFTAVAGQPGVVRIESNGCTRLDNSCLNFPAQGAGSEGRATVSALVALASGLASPPAAPLTVRGDVNAGGGLSLNVYNTDVPTGGVTIQARGAVNTAGFPPLVSTPGMPGNLSVIDHDGSLPADVVLPSGDVWGLFTSVFNMWPRVYPQQPAALKLDCGVAGCSADTVRTAALLNPGRVLWLQGDLVLDSAGAIGSPSDPVLLVVTGNFSATVAPTCVEPIEASTCVYGLIYVQSVDWVNAGSAGVRGAVIAEGNLTGTGSPELVYDPAILKRLRLATGSFVRVPGGWKDF